MLGWLPKLLTDADSVEDRLRAELRSAAEREDWLSRRLHVVEQRLDAADGAIRELGHRLARVDGRTSILRKDHPDEEHSKP